jgi:hypothetical protein
MLPARRGLHGVGAGCASRVGVRLTRWRMTIPTDTVRPRPETRRVARMLAATFGVLFLLIFALIALAT